MGDAWPLFLFLAGLVAAWSMLILGVMRSMLSKGIGDLEEKISGLSAIGRDYRKLERALLELKAELPVQYVRREDHLRDTAVVYIKIDKLAEKIDDVQQLILKSISQKGE
ncbi:MAG: hypothetical protein A4E68_01923 [Syntrophaceae bacterium PtaB.Bin095]|jgi:hypothetical protein|nr:MAG: hypothetical protein A4E68_01923 [Syntrophaceae bacterium PtaB.Bin095]